MYWFESSSFFEGINYCWKNETCLLMIGLGFWKRNFLLHSKILSCTCGILTKKQKSTVQFHIKLSNLTASLISKQAGTCKTSRKILKIRFKVSEFWIWWQDLKVFLFVKKTRTSLFLTFSVFTCDTNLELVDVRIF